MFELPDYKGRNREYVKSSLRFFTYHAGQTLPEKECEKAIEAIHSKAEEWDIDLAEIKLEEDFS